MLLFRSLSAILFSFKLIFQNSEPICSNSKNIDLINFIVNE